MTNLNINLSIEFLRENIWKNSKIADSTIRDKLSSVRRKIPLLPIQTNFGIGYMLSVNKT